MKTSFVLHYDSLSVIDKMSDEQVGKLLRKMRSYHNGNEYDPGDLVVEVAFEQFKNQFDRDLEKFKIVCERNSNNGSKGGRPKKPKKPTGLSGFKEKPKKAENDNDNDNDNDNKKEKTLTSSLEDFYEFRKKIRSPMTDRAKQLLLSKLEKLGDNDEHKILILEQSIMNGRKGIFSLKDGEFKGDDFYMKEIVRLRGDNCGTSFREEYGIELHDKRRKWYKKKNYDEAVACVRK